MRLRFNPNPNPNTNPNPNPTPNPNQAAGSADAYFISIQELIDIEAKEGLPDRAVRRGAN